MIDDSDARDRGSGSLTIVLLAPLLLVLMFIGFQAAMWNHTRTEARVIARETAVLVARDGLSAPQAVAAGSAALAADSILTEAKVSVDAGGATIVVTIAGDAPGLLRGTSAPVHVTVVLPREGWVPL